MKKDLRVLPSADADIDECFYYLQEQSNLETAWRFIDGLKESFERLQQMPIIGSPRQFASGRLPGLRQWPVKGFANILIFYLPTDDCIEVIRVLHSKRDLAAIFDDQR